MITEKDVEKLEQTAIDILVGNRKKETHFEIAKLKAQVEGYEQGVREALCHLKFHVMRTVKEKHNE